VSGRTVAEAVADARRGAPVLWLPSFADAEPVLRARLRAEDLVLVLGAGDVRALGESIVTPDRVA
jgi:UDP-N-acetylmuramate-alanine ligase